MDDALQIQTNQEPALSNFYLKCSRPYFLTAAEGSYSDCLICHSHSESTNPLPLTYNGTSWVFYFIQSVVLTRHKWERNRRLITLHLWWSGEFSEISFWGRTFQAFFLQGLVPGPRGCSRLRTVPSVRWGSMAGGSNHTASNKWLSTAVPASHIYLPTSRTISHEPAFARSPTCPWPLQHYQTRRGWGEVGIKRDSGLSRFVVEISHFGKFYSGLARCEHVARGLASWNICPSLRDSQRCLSVSA